MAPQFNPEPRRNASTVEERFAAVLQLAPRCGDAGALWLVPVLVILLLTAALAVAAHTAAPFVVYTFF